MDVVHFNRSPRHVVAPLVTFEDAALQDAEAAYTLDADFESFGERAGEFQLVPGVICRPRSDGMILMPERRLDP